MLAIVLGFVSYLQIVFKFITTWTPSFDPQVKELHEELDYPRVNYFNSFVHTKIGDINLIDQINNDISTMLDDESKCMIPWPNVVNCATWYESKKTNMRYLLTNSVPVYFVPPYCPFGIGDGYCFSGSDHKNCSTFFNMSCPAQTHRKDTVGDVVVAQLFLYGIPSNPNPLNNTLPYGIYERDSLLWAYNNGTNNSTFEYSNSKELELLTNLWKYSDLIDESDDDVSSLLLDDGDDTNDDVNISDALPGWAVIALHITGQQVKGPDEAEGMNVDYSGLHLETMCGGHVTPPIGYVFNIIKKQKLDYII